MEIMRCTVRRQLLDVDVPTLVALTYDYINVKATFSSEWAGMQKWLHIRNVENQSIVAHVVFDNDEIGESVGLNLSAGEWDVWIHGALYEDNTLIKRITTNVKKIRVEATGSEDEILPSIGPSVAEQAVAAAERAEAAADDAEQYAEDAQGYAESAQGYTNEAQTYADAALLSKAQANNAANEARNSAFNAAHYADLAATAVSHYPKIENKYWYVWDATNETWSNTGVVAEGATFTPAVDSYGNLSWTNNAGLPNPSPVNLVALFDNVPELQARMDEILAEAEEGIADIEEQRDTILASIAAAAELGTDTTLTTAGMAADAKATGDRVFPLEDAIYMNSSVPALWTVGAIGSSNGTNSTSTTRLRTAYLPDSVISIVCNSGYRYILFAYNGDTYVGTWNGTTFSKSANWLTTETVFSALPDYKYRVVLARDPDSGNVTTDDCVGVNITTTTDVTLTLNGKAADALTTGTQIRQTYSLSGIPPQITTIPTGTDYDTLTTPGNYRVLSAASASTMVNCPSVVAHRLTVEELYGTNALKQTIQTATATMWRVYTNSSWGVWQSVRSYTTTVSYIGDRTADIRKRLTNNGVCELGHGTFMVSALDMPANTRLVGSGMRTLLVVDSAATGYAIKMNYGCTIENVKIVGPMGEDWTANGTETDRHGIVINTEGDATTNRNRMIISNVEITGFDGAGIYMISTGYNYDNSASITNCYIHHNNYGIDNPKRSEYNRVCNCSVANNFVGIRNNGGNNLYSNCGINGNVTGLVMDADEITGASNNSHGTFSCCNFNHNSDGQGNTTNAIRINAMVSGEVFTGCQIAYGNIVISNSVGMNFNACNFLSNTAIDVSGTGFTLFSACVFISSSESPVTKSGAGVLKFDNCYYRSGNPCNPVT